jgi:hypothetical protein
MNLDDILNNSEFIGLNQSFGEGNGEAYEDIEGMDSLDCIPEARRRSKMGNNLKNLRFDV